MSTFIMGKESVAGGLNYVWKLDLFLFKVGKRG